jgi:hypothetical protein
MFNTAVNNNASLVYGSNTPIYFKAPKPSIDFFFQPVFKETNDYPITVAPTNCTLIKRSVLDNIPGPFHLIFNLTGGEDSFLMRQIHYNGEKMYRPVKSKAYEIIPKNRFNLNWIIKKSFRCATSLIIQDKMYKLGYVLYFKRILNVVLKISFGLVMAIPASYLPPSNKFKYMALDRTC